MKKRLFKHYHCVNDQEKVYIMIFFIYMKKISYWISNMLLAIFIRNNKIPFGHILLF